MYHGAARCDCVIVRGSSLKRFVRRSGEDIERFYSRLASGGVTSRRRNHRIRKGRPCWPSSTAETLICQMAAPPTRYFASGRSHRSGPAICSRNDRGIPIISPGAGTRSSSRWVQFNHRLASPETLQITHRLVGYIGIFHSQPLERETSQLLHIGVVDTAARKIEVL